MKILTALIVIVFPGLIVFGQQARTPAPPSVPKVLSEISVTSSNKIVKGSPFSAEAVSETTQTLADGNRIVRRWTEKLYRSSEGKFRREGSGIPGSAFGSVIATGSGVTILDPVGGARYTLDENGKTARTFTLRTPAPVIVGSQISAELKQKIEAAARADGGPIILNSDGSTADVTIPAVKAAEFKAKADEFKKKTEEFRMRADEIKAAVAQTAIMAVPAIPVMPTVGNSKWDTRTEQLGMQNFEGVDAEGTRTITTIPADAIGNERPIEIVYERWYSKELDMIVFSRHFDPRFGEQTYRLTNINRSEPDPSLFQVPTSYRIVNQTRTTVAPRATAERVAPSKTAQASRP
jgi:hypothetical protein